MNKPEDKAIRKRKRITRKIQELNGDYKFLAREYELVFKVKTSHSF